MSYKNIATLTSAQQAAGVTGVAGVKSDGSLIGPSGAPVSAGGIKRAELSTVRAAGNSYDAGAGASTTTKRYTSLVAASKGWTEINIATGGSTIAGWMDAQVGSAVVLAGDNWTFSGSLNDLCRCGPSPLKLKQFESCLYALLSFCAIPDTKKVFPATNSGSSQLNTAQVTYTPGSAQWPLISTIFAGKAAYSRMFVYSATNGATATATVTGDTVMFWYGQVINTASYYLVSVDGVTYGNGKLGTQPVADTSKDDGGWMMACQRIGGLSNGPHTVTVTVVGSTNVVLGCFAGYDSKSLIGANVYCGNIVPLTAAGWTANVGKNAAAAAVTDGQSSWLYESTACGQWNNVIASVCNRLKSEGLNVNLVDVASVVNILGADADNIHLADPQHWQFAQQVLRVINMITV